MVHLRLIRLSAGFWVSEGVGMGNQKVCKTSYNVALNHVLLLLNNKIDVLSALVQLPENKAYEETLRVLEMVKGDVLRVKMG